MGKIQTKISLNIYIDNLCKKDSSFCKQIASSHFLLVLLSFLFSTTSKTVNAKFCPPPRFSLFSISDMAFPGRYHSRRPYWNYAIYRDRKKKIESVGGHIEIMLFIEIEKLELDCHIVIMLLKKIEIFELTGGHVEIMLIIAMEKLRLFIESEKLEWIGGHIEITLF